MANKTIYLVRHGETEYNRLGIVQGGGIDSVLNPRGRLQARAFYEHYRETTFEAVLTSELQRTHQTMEPFVEKPLPWERHADIDEMNWGIFEGKRSTPQMHERYKAIMEAWRRGDYHARLEGGESAHELGQRLDRFVEHLHDRLEDRLLVCSHGRALRCMLTIMLGLPLSAMQQFKHANTGLYELELKDGTFKLLRENDLTHLEKMDLHPKPLQSKP